MRRRSTSLRLAEIADRRAQIFGVIVERRRLGAAAALADAALVVAEHENPASASAPAIWPKIGMPATVSSRSVGPEPPTSTTAGRGLPPASAGLESVPASEKPFAGTRTCSSLGARHRHPPRRDRRDVFADDFQALRRHADAQQPSGFVAPDFAGDRRTGRRPRVTGVRRALITRLTVWICSSTGGPTVIDAEPSGAM